jgi:hypothetical protein
MYQYLRRKSTLKSQHHLAFNLKNETIDLIKAFAASYLAKETDQQITFGGFLN